MSKRKWFFIVPGIVLGVLVILWSNYRRNSVCVSIKNESGFAVDSLVLRYDDGEIKYNGLQVNDETDIRFKNSGEDSYHVIAILRNGTVLETNGMYVESGYSTTETIYPDTIISAYPY